MGFKNGKLTELLGIQKFKSREPIKEVPVEDIGTEGQK